MNQYILIIEEDTFELKHLFRFISHLDLEIIDEPNEVRTIGVTCDETVADELESFDCVDEIIRV